MAYPTPLKYCLDLPQMNGGCCHWLRSETTGGFNRHHPESQTRCDSERIGFLVLREKWIGEVEQKQLELIPRKRARCYGCRTNFIVIWEKYAHMFNWPSIIDGRYAETFFNSYHYLLIEDFKLADKEYTKALSAAAAKRHLIYLPLMNHRTQLKQKLQNLLKNPKLSNNITWNQALITFSPFSILSVYA